MINEERIDNCITDLIVTIANDINTKMCKSTSMQPNDEIEALASLIKAKAMIKLHHNYSLSDSGISKE